MIKNTELNAIVYQAIDSLNNIFDDEELSAKLSQIIVPVYSTLITHITYT